MATFKCPDCGKKVSTTALSCPKCGHVVTEADKSKAKGPMSLWKRIVLGAVIFAVIGSCFSNISDKQSKKEAEEQAVMAPLVKEVIQTSVQNAPGLKPYGTPTFEANGDYASLTFPKGPMPDKMAELFARGLCTRIIRAYAKQGLHRRSFAVYIYTQAVGVTGNKNLVHVYGSAEYSSSNDSVTWKPME